MERELVISWYKEWSVYRRHRWKQERPHEQERQDEHEAVTEGKIHTEEK